MLVDGGSTCHVVTGPEYCCDIIDKHVDIQVGNRQICVSNQSGKCVLVHENKIVVLQDVRIAVGFLHNILSENLVLSQGARIIKEGSNMQAFSSTGDRLIFSATRKPGNSLFFLESSYLCQGTTLADQVKDGQSFLTANTNALATSALCPALNGHQSGAMPYHETTGKPAPSTFPNTEDSKHAINPHHFCLQHGLDLAEMDGLDKQLQECPPSSIAQASDLVFEAAARVFQDQEDFLSCQMFQDQDDALSSISELY
jgi:hypothetical protein